MHLSSRFLSTVFTVVSICYDAHVDANFPLSLPRSPLVNLSSQSQDL
jgi:hypothetical protein